MMYEVEVRPNPNGPYFQYYTETIEAATSHDAEARVQRSNPGCIVRTTKSWTEYDNDDDSDNHSESSMNGGAILFLLVLAFLFYAWKWILLIGGISFVIWLVIKFVKESE